ncbi:MAG: mannitol-1-phosphate 5-dehydrogenase, partial [Candidatus Thermoplasmatota archaeon]|nr:mannitol-1-phosphate 5-dehydrogenase [Candidatus Thermoplasmatota archaeon]
MSEIIIVGAGAIGRGFLPWIFDLNEYEFVFVDINQELIDRFNHEKQYITYRAKAQKLEKMVVPVKKGYHLSEFSSSKHSNAVAVFMNVGPRNCLSAASVLKGMKCPIILCENDPQTVVVVKNALNYDRVYFAIPDVITSNTAAPDILAEDPVSVVTEDGILFVDVGAKGIKGNIHFCDKSELRKQWTAKLYLHNTPHAIAAYLGALAGVHYVHEAMKIPEIKKIVTGAMSEMLTSLKLKWDIPHSFLEWYADKEIQRFSNELLYDPISRVAREPLRKLELEGRLIGAAQICLSLGFIPQNILIGIVSAILFENELDPDRHLSFLRKALSPNILLTYIIGLREGEVL